MSEIYTHQKKENGIRRQWDPKTRKWYFSIVDVIDVTTRSTDPRNYWKVLKNRLKKAQNQLVTRCNQLKMQSSDGKFYLTDTGDEETILDILQIVSPEYFPSIKEMLSNLEKPIPEDLYNDSPSIKSSGASVENQTDSKWASYPQLSENIQNNETKEETEDESLMLLVDGYVTSSSVIIKAFVAGVSIENISILATRDTIRIKGERKTQSRIVKENYDEQELNWGKFTRTINLPQEIKTEEIEAVEQSGLLIIKLPLVNKNSPRVVRVRTI